MLPDVTRIQDIPFETAIIAGLAALAVCFLLYVWRSELHIAALRRDNAELVRSMDSVLRSRPRDTHLKPIARHSPIRLSRQETSDTRPAEPLADRSNRDLGTNAILALADPEAAPEPAPPEDPACNARIGGALARSIAEEHLEISLQPIVSISKGQAVAFDAFASVELDGKGPVHVRRLAPSDTLEVVDFDVSMFLTSVQTARQRLGTVSERMKLHLAVSEELLADPEPVSEICAILTVHPAIVRSIVISLPPAARHRADLLHAVRRLFDTGLSLALELGPTLGRDTADLPPIEFLKIDADKLFAIAASASGAAPDRLAGLWADPRTRIIACGVANEEQAARLVDLGVDMMTGTWFSEPRRLNRTDAAQLAEAGAD